MLHVVCVWSQSGGPCWATFCMEQTTSSVIGRSWQARGSGLVNSSMTGCNTPKCAKTKTNEICLHSATNLIHADCHVHSQYAEQPGAEPRKAVTNKHSGTGCRHKKKDTHTRTHTTLCEHTANWCREHEGDDCRRQCIQPLLGRESQPSTADKGDTPIVIWYPKRNVAFL